jgi:hypothetical protein
MRLRFSLRAMLAAVAIAALVCLWRDRPRRMAERFVAAVEAKRYAEADGLTIQADGPIIEPFLKRDDRNRVKAERLPQSAADWLAGRCFVVLHCEDFSGLGASIDENLVASGQGLAKDVTGVPIERARAAVRYPPDPVPVRVDPIMKQQLRID